MVEKQAQANRRGSRRKPPRSKPKIEFRVGTTGLGVNLASALLDLSQTGARLATTKPLEPDAAVELVLTSVWERKTVRVLGRVVRCEGQEGGDAAVSMRFDRPIDYGLWLKLT